MRHVLFCGSAVVLSCAAGLGIFLGFGPWGIPLAFVVSAAIGKAAAEWESETRPVESW